MKTSTKIFLGIVGGCALSVSARAATADQGDHPYKGIPVTNVFRLKTPALPPEQPKPPPPSITLQGIATITGRRQALFKVAMPARPLDAAKEISYVLSEDERAGEIEVLEINEQSGTVKFSNHGVVQVLTLKQ